MRMHFQKSWEGQLTTQVRLEHVVWAEMLWAATLATFYAVVVSPRARGLRRRGGAALCTGRWLPLAIPLLFLAGGGVCGSVGLYLHRDPAEHRSHGAAVLPRDSSDRVHEQHVFSAAAACLGSTTLVLANPLHHLAEGLRWLLLRGDAYAASRGYAAALSLLVFLLVLVPIDLRLLRKRVFGDA